MNLDALVIALLLSGWALCSGLSWLLLAASRRGAHALVTLPLALAAGWGFALLLPLLGFKDGRALALSFGFAALGGWTGTYVVVAALTMIRRHQAPQSSSGGKTRNLIDQE